MTVWPASFFFWGASGICRGYNRPLRFPQPARANQSGLCLEHHPSPSHNLLRHGDPSHRHLRAIPAWRTASRPVHDRQLTDALTGLRHGDPAHRCLSGILARQSILLTGFRHGNPAHRYFRDIPAWRSVLLTGPRHGDPFHRYLGGILAWRRGLLSTLWHGDPQPKQFWGRVVCRRKGNRYRCRDYGRVHDRVRHGDPTRMHFRAIPAGRTASRPVHDQSLTDLLPITNRCSDRSSAGLSNR